LYVFREHYDIGLYLSEARCYNCQRKRH